MTGFVYKSTSHAYEELIAPPPMHERHPSKSGDLGYPSWSPEFVEYKDRGVVIVWKSAVALPEAP